MTAAPARFAPSSQRKIPVVIATAFLAGLAFGTGLPWALKMPLGHLVDVHWRWKDWLVYVGAPLIALSVVIMYALIAAGRLLRQAEELQSPCFQIREKRIPTLSKHSGRWNPQNATLAAHFHSAQVYDAFTPGSVDSVERIVSGDG